MRRTNFICKQNNLTVTLHLLEADIMRECQSAALKSQKWPCRWWCQTWSQL